MSPEGILIPLHCPHNSSGRVTSVTGALGWRHGSSASLSPVPNTVLEA